MKKHWIEFGEEQPESPLTFWVHIEVGDKPYYESLDFQPAKPSAIPGKGYYTLKVEWDGVHLQFISLHELDHFIDILSRKNMPTSQILSNRRPGGAGPNSHWLSRLPTHLTPWSKRENLTAFLRKTRNSFQQELKKLIPLE